MPDGRYQLYLLLFGVVFSMSIWAFFSLRIKRKKREKYNEISPKEF
jgi:hypothetical protein